MNCHKFLLATVYFEAFSIIGLFLLLNLAKNLKQKQY